MLATLYKDERCQHLPAYNILEKMYLDRIIRRSELEEFQGLLLPHQSVTLDGNLKNNSEIKRRKLVTIISDCVIVLLQVQPF